MRSFQCFSPAFIGKPGINRGNKIILPSSALNELSRMKVSYPMTFMIMNPEMSIRTYCGVLEFDAEENSCNIPYWMMNNLCLGEGSEVIVRSVNLKKGTFVKIRPHETKFIELANPKAVLEQELTHYSVLHKGDTICITYGGREYMIDIVDTKPEDVVVCVEADINLEFDAPKDYVEPKVVPKTDQKKKQFEEE